ncbi:exo-alpha-sialidase [Limihaloglobus sulfuriphilus]|nr:exo-alpha-sialidase [Limihaloglobus sulfuriphilus]
MYLRKMFAAIALILVFTVVMPSMLEASQYEVYQPQITKGFVYNPEYGELKYNHDSSIEYFQGRFYAAWNGNTNWWEGRPGQKNYWAFSDDGIHWSGYREFEDTPVFGSPSWQTEWQPNLLNYKDKELWALWTKAGGFIVSKLTDPAEGWTHRVIFEVIEYDGAEYFIFPSQECTVLEDGSVLVPVILREKSDLPQDQRKWFCTFLKSSDAGETWQYYPQAFVAHPHGPYHRSWEPMGIVQDDKNVRMFVRDMHGDLLEPDKTFFTALGNRGGTAFADPVYSAIRTVSSRMWLGNIGSRKIMVQHDSAANRNTGDRINIALFSSRTGRDDFVAGTSIIDDELGICYPQAVLKDEDLYVVYTSGHTPRAIKTARVSPAPRNDKYYIMPRSRDRALTSNDLPRFNPSFIRIDQYNSFDTGGDIDIKDAFSFTCWLRPDGGEGVLYQLSGPDGSKFFVEQDKQGSLFVNFAGEKVKSNVSLPADGRWSMLSGMFDLKTGTGCLKVNCGEEAGLKFDAADFARGTYRLVLGDFLRGAGFDSADMRIYESRITAQQAEAYFSLTAKRHGSSGTTDIAAVKAASLEISPLDYTAKQDIANVVPGEITCYAGHNDIVSRDVNDLGQKSVTITGWIRQKPHNNGVIFDALDSEGDGGFSIRHDFFPKIYVRIGDKDYPLGHRYREGERVYMKGFNQPLNDEYYFFCVVIDNSEKKILFWEDNKLSDEQINFDAESLSSDEPVAFFRYCGKERAKNHFPFYGGVFNVNVYDRKLSEPEIRFDHNRFADMFGFDELSGDIKAAPEARWSVGADNYDSLRFIDSEAPVAAGVKHEEYMGRQCLLLSGSSSCGVDMDGFDPDKSRIEMDLPIRIDYPIVSEELRIMSFGDDGQIILGMLNGDSDNLHIRIDGKWHRAAAFELGKWSQIKLIFEDGKVAIKNGDSRNVFDTGRLTPRLYLGDGYPHGYIAPADKFRLDVDEFELKVQ